MALSIPIMNPVRFRDNSKRPDYDNYYPLPDTQQIGELMEEGVYPSAYVQDWIKGKSIVIQLRTTTTAPDLIIAKPSGYTSVSGVDISPSGWTGDDVYKYTYTPDFTGFFYLFFEDTNYRSDYLYCHDASAIYRSNFISGVDSWTVNTDGGTSTVISNSNDQLNIEITYVGTPTSRPIVELSVDASFASRDWIMKIKADTGDIVGYETDSGFISFAVEFDGTEKIIYGNGIYTGNKILLYFDSSDATIEINIDYATVEAVENIIPKRRLIEIDYENSENDYGMIFYDGASNEYQGKILLTGRLLDPQPGNDRSVFESDRGALELLRSTPKKLYQLKLSDIHRAMVDQINHIFACDTLSINGENYQLSENIEVEQIEGSDLVNINANIQQTENDYFIT